MDDNGTKHTILLAEDDQAAREMLTMLLESLGHKVIPAGNGHHASQIYSENGSEITCLITDKSMPVMNGMELVKTIRQRNEILPIVMITSESDHLAFHERMILNDANVVILPKSLESEKLNAAILEASLAPLAVPVFRR